MPNNVDTPFHHLNIIIQAAIDTVTTNVYYGSNAACWTPNKYLLFDPANTGTNMCDIEHFCALVVHPIMGETITSCMKLANDEKMQMQET